MTSAEIPGDVYVDARWVHVRRLEPGLLAQLALGDVLRVLPRLVEQPGRQLDEPRPAGWRYWRRHSSPVLVVESEDDHRAGVLQHQPAERLPSGSSGRRIRSARSANTQSSRCRSSVDSTGQLSSGTSARSGVAMDRTLPVPCGARYRGGGGRRDRIASLTQDEAEERAALIDVRRYDIASTCAACSRARPSETTSTIAFGCREPGASTFVDCVAEVRAPPSTASTLDPATVRRRAAAAHRPRRATTCSSSAHPVRHRQRGAASCAPSTRPTSWSTSGPPSSRTPRAGCGRASTSRTSRPRTGSWSTAPDAGRSPATAGPTRSRPTATAAGRSGGSRTRRRCRRTSWSSTPARSTRSAGSAAATASASTAGSRCDRSSSGTPTSCSRVTEQGLAFFGERFGDAVPAGALRPGVRPEHGRRDGELGLRHLERRRALPQPPTHGQRALVGHRAAARDGAHVVRRPGHDALVGRPVAQRGVRVLGVHLGGRRGHRVRRRLGDVPRRAGARGLRDGHGPGHATRSAPRCRTSTQRWPTSTRSPTSRARRCCPSSSPTSARSFVEGLRAYFRDHAWGNTRLDDLMSAVGAAADRDLSDWTDGLVRPGRHGHPDPDPTAPPVRPAPSRARSPDRTGSTSARTSPRRVGRVGEGRDDTASVEGCAPRCPTSRRRTCTSRTTAT